MTNKIAYAVIGSSFGDCSKGLTTDYLCSKTKGPVTVIRFNGGAQAGHTVQTPAGQRHVFHHFSSGSLLGAQTYLGQHFVCNPILFHEERAKLLGKGVPEVTVSADPRCLITTPWDMMINRLIETQRGLKRHGSCGVGINETVTRNAETTYGFTAKRLDSMSEPKAFFRSLQHEYVPYRLGQLELDINDLSGSERENLFSEGILEHYLDDLNKFAHSVQFGPPAQLVGNSLIFEGAQGLGLDEKRGTFPYVTRSNTGLQNVIDIALELGLEKVKAVYVTRPYITRHGEGPLLHELRAKPWAAVEDLTNIPNKWQGMLRFGQMDETELVDRITLDLAEARYKVQNKIKISPSLMLSCVDQIPDSLDKGRIPFWQDGVKHFEPVAEFLRVVRQHIGASGDDLSYVSLGPTRADVLPLISSNATVPADD